MLDTSKAEKAGIGMRPVEEAMRESMQRMARAGRSMKNILVTGGLGFIGSNFIRLLMKDGVSKRSLISTSRPMPVILKTCGIWKIMIHMNL